MQTIKGPNEGNSGAIVVAIVAQQKSKKDDISGLNVRIWICQNKSKGSFEIHGAGHSAQDVFQIGPDQEDFLDGGTGLGLSGTKLLSLPALMAASILLKEKDMDNPTQSCLAAI